MTHPYYDPTVMAAFKDWTTAIQYLQPNTEEPVGDELEDAQEEQPVPTEENMRVHGALTQALAKLDGVTAGTEEFQFAVEDAVTALDVLRTDPAALSAGDDFTAQLEEVLEMLEKYRNIRWGFVGDDAEKDPGEPMLDTMADSAGYLMSMHIEPDRASRRRAERRIRVLTAAAGPLPKVARWRGVLGYEGQFTGDGRSIQPNALRWETPLPLRYVGVDNGGHDGAQVVGTVETIERREGGIIWGTGIFDLGSPHGQEAFRVVDSKIQRGVSLDLDDVSFEVRAAPKEQAVEQELAEDGSKTLMTVKPTDEQTITTDARVRAATVVAIPAFATAFIETYTDEENVEGMAEADTFAVEEVYGVQVPERIIDRVLATLNFAELASIAYLPIDDEYPDDDSSEDSQEFKRKNWVEQTGGLPRFIKRISKHLRKKGMTESHAIATAVNVVKKMCASGDTNFPGKQNVNAKSRAQACAAVAQWEAKKAAARAKKAGATDTFAAKLRTDVKDIDKELDALEKASAKDVQEAEALLAELDEIDADIAAIELGEPPANAEEEAATAEEEPPATPAKLRVRFAYKEEDHPRDILGRWTDKETAAATNRGAQDALISQGLLDKGGSDGVVGPKTIAAVKAWQKANGLPVTGRLDAGQLSLLKSQPGIDRVSARGKRAIAKAKLAVERAQKKLEKVKASAEKSRARLKEQQAKAQKAVEKVKARQAAIQQDIQEAKAALRNAEREYGVGSSQALKAQKAVDGAMTRYDKSEEALQSALERAEDFVVKFEDLEISLADRIESAQDSLDDKKQNLLDVTEKSAEDVAAAKEKAAERAERAREKAKRDSERAAEKAARDKSRAAKKSTSSKSKSGSTAVKTEGKSGRAPTTRRAPVAPPPLPRTTTSSPRPKVAVAARTRTFRFNPTQLRWPKGVRQGGQWMDTPWKIGTDFLDWWDDFDDKSGVKSRLGVEHVDGPNGLRRAVSDLEDLDSPDILYNTQNLQDMVNNLWTDGEAAGLDGEFFDKMQETYDKLNDISYLSQTEWDNLVEANHEADVPTDEVEAPRIPDHILADFKGGSAEKYIQNGRFTPEREKLHREIIGSFLAGVTKPEGTPEFRMMGGGPAAGKSRMTQLHPELEENSVLVNADEVKALLPEYNELISAGEAGKAARFVHEESSYVTKLLTAEAIGRGFNILLDGTGDSSLAKLRGKIADARASGYLVDGYYVTVDTEIAVQRSNARALKTGRHVPESIIRNTHQSVSAILPQAMDDFDSLVLVDNGGGEAVKVMEKVPGGTPEILDPELWEKFLRKAD